MLGIHSLSGRCTNCALPCANQTLLCTTCTHLLKEPLLRCSQCLSKTLPSGQCMWCIEHPTVKTLCGITYHPIIAQHLIPFKKRPSLAIARGLIHPLVEVIIDNKVTIDAIVPIPQHWKRRILRPLNPASLLADQLAKTLSIKFDERALTRSRLTRHQFGSPLKERQTQQRNSFKAEQCDFQSVALFDDVITSGATINAAIKAFNKTNPSTRMYLFAVARADFH